MQMRLLGRQLLPFTDSQQNAISRGLQQILSGVAGPDEYFVRSVTPMSQEVDGQTQVLVVNVTLVVTPPKLKQVLEQLQVTIQNAQLAGWIRVEGMYNLQRLTVDTYSITAAAPSAAPFPGPSTAPSLTPGPSEQPGPGPQPSSSATAIAVQLPDPPVPTLEAPEGPAPAPAPAPEAPLPAPEVLAAVPEGPAAVPETPLPALVVSASVPEGPAPVPETPLPAPEVLAAVPEGPAAVPETPPPALVVSASVPEGPAPAPETPLPAPEASSPADAPFLTFAKATQMGEPSLAPGQELLQPRAGQPTREPTLPPVQAPELWAPEGSFAPALLLPQQGGPARQPIFPPAPAPSSGQVNLTLALQGGNPLAADNTTALQGALAGLIGNLSASQISVQNASPAPSVASTGKRRLLGFHAAQDLQRANRRLLQQQGGSTVPVTINAGPNEQQVVTQLSNLSNSGNLTNALQAAGLNVTNARIVNVNGQPVITANVPPPETVGTMQPDVAPRQAPSGAPSTGIPVPQDNDSWNNIAILWAVLGGLAGILLLGVIVVCCASRCAAARMRRKYPPAAPHKKALSSDSSKDSSEVCSRSAETPASVGDDGSSRNGAASVDKLLLQEQEEAARAEEHRSLLLSSRDLSTYQGQFKYYVPSKADLGEPNIAEVVASKEAPNLPKGPVQGKSLPRTASNSDQLHGIVEEEPRSPSALGTPTKQQHPEQVAPGSRAHLADFSVMQLVASGNLLAGKYQLEEGCIKGDRAIVVAAKEKGAAARPCMCKFITSEVDFNRELQIYELLPEDPPIPEVMDAFPPEALPGTGLPACIVIAVGDYSLARWPSKLERPPDAAQKRATFHMICKAVATLHRKMAVHGNLTPDNILWFANENAIKLSSFSFWAFDGAPIPLHPALRYASPETVTASAAGKQSMPASFALDCWSLGAIGYEILCRNPVFGSTYKDTDVIQSLLGNQPLPWELDLDFFDSIPNKDARSMIRSLLKRDPAVRWDMEQVLESPYFGGLPLLPSRTSLRRNPSYPKQAALRTTVNPQTPVRGFSDTSADFHPNTPGKHREAIVGVASPASSLAESSSTGGIRTPPPVATSAQRDVQGPLESTPQSSRTLTPPSAWNNAMFGGTSQPSTPGSLSAVGAERSTPNILYNIEVVENPAFSAVGKSMTGPSAPAGTKGSPRILHPSHSGAASVIHTTHSATFTDEKSEVVDRSTGIVSTDLALPVGRRASDTGSARMPKGDLLQSSSSLVGGHSRSASATGWESLENMEDASSEVTSEMEGSGPTALRRISHAALPTLSGSAIVVGISIEEVKPALDNTNSEGNVLESLLSSGAVTTEEAPMVANRAASSDQPVFMLHLGAQIVFKIHVAAGSRRGWVPLPLNGPTKLRIAFSKSDQGESLQVFETESDISQWKGFAVWNSSHPRVEQQAGKFGQQTRLIVTTDYICKGQETVVCMEHEIYAVMCAPGQRLPSGNSWKRPMDFATATKNLSWVQSSAKGVVSFAKVVRQRQIE